MLKLCILYINYLGKLAIFSLPRNLLAYLNRLYKMCITINYALSTYLTFVNVKLILL